VAATGGGATWKEFDVHAGAGDWRRGGASAAGDGGDGDKVTG